MNYIIMYIRRQLQPHFLIHQNTDKGMYSLTVKETQHQKDD